MSEKLFEAIADGATERVRALIEADPALASARGPEGVSAVLTARYRGRSEIVETLLGAGADLDVFDAAALGDTDRLAQLLDDEPHLVDALATDGFTALQLACFFGHPGAAALLLGRGAPLEAVAHNDMAIHALNAAVAAGHADIASLLLDAGADPDAPQHGGWTPLMSAAANGDDAAVDLLLGHGADVTARADDGGDAAGVAEQRGHAQLAERLRTISR